MSQIMTQSFIRAVILTVIVLHSNEGTSVSATTTSTSAVSTNFPNEPTIGVTEVIHQTTESTNAEPSRILAITAKSYINELYVDDIKVIILVNEDRWYLSDEVNLSSDNRLISILATDVSNTCGGILASVTGDYLVTDASWKCSTENPPGWYALGFDDSSWSDAYVIGKNGEVTTPNQCKNLTEIPSISSNASWIWTASIANAPVYDQNIFCRGYLPVCDLDSPCLNGGTCNRNDPELCTCPTGISGKYCDIGHPINAVSLAGETVTFNCMRSHSSITWWFTAAGSINTTMIVNDCKVLPDYSKLFALDTADGSCNLVISNVLLGHAGTYACEDLSTDDDRTSAQLIVLNGVQQCWFSPSFLEYGQNVTFTCQIHYSGNWAPAIRWIDHYRKAVTNATTSTTSNSVTSSITIPAYLKIIPPYTTTSFFNESSLPAATDDIRANNTPANSYSVATAALEFACPDGFAQMSRFHCYRIIYESHDFYSAQYICQQLHPGAYLVVISDASEQIDIENYLTGSGIGSNVSVWISGFATDGCYNFAWQPLPGYFLPMTYTNWATGEPDCANGVEACAALYSPSYQWHDWSCIPGLYPLCEYEPEPK